MQKDAGIEFKNLKVDGGASNNDLLMQIQSNLLGNKVIRPKTTETTAIGAAFMAGLATGFWSNISELSNLWEMDKIFNPNEDFDSKSIIDLWDKRIGKILSD
jgi:glycerol kinase